MSWRRHPDAGSEVADDGIYLIGGQGLQRGAYIGQCDQVEVRVVGAQQLVGGVVLDHSDFQAVQVLQFTRLCAAFVGKDDNGKVEVRAGESQVALAFRGRHDAGQQVDAAFACLRQYFGPATGFDRF